MANENRNQAAPEPQEPAAMPPPQEAFTAPQPEPGAPPPKGPDSLAADIEEEREALERGRRRNRTILRVVITLVLLALGIFLLLLILSKAAQYDSIGSMLRHMAGELALMWERIVS